MNTNPKTKANFLNKQKKYHHKYAAVLNSEPN